MILADCGITGDDAIQVSEVFHCVQVGAIDADARRTVCFSWRDELCYTLFDSLPKKLPALDKQLSRSLLTVASLKMTLPSKRSVPLR